MDKEYVMQVANMVIAQLLATTSIDVIGSWGVSNFIATIYKNMPALAFHVNGRLFQGHVIIALNGSDYYEIHLQNSSGAKCINEEVCFDELGDGIDRAVEGGTNEEEYNQFCEQYGIEL